MNLLINLPTMDIYKNTKVESGVPILPPLTQVTLAGSLDNAKIIDLNIKNNLREIIIREKPKYIAITVLTASYNQMLQTCKLIKETNKNIKIILGGHHISAFPEESLKESKADFVVIGEGDKIISEIVNGKNKKKINTGYIKDLDSLPFPDWSLIDINLYKTPRLICKARPVGSIETSRGCAFNCTFCSKILGNKFRAKSPERVVNEIENMLRIGFKEIHTIDDGFSTDLNRAKEICDEIIRRKLKFHLNIRSGMRVDRVDIELLEKMKKAGCYRISYGVESGNQEILNNIKKGTTLERIKEVFKMTNEAGIETLGFFMIGLPGETEETMQDTIDFAKELNPYIAKLGILTPLPGTKLFNDWDSKGYIISKNWSDYTYNNPEKIYNHPNLNWKTIHKYYNKFFREYYLRPSFILNRIVEDLKKGKIIDDVLAFLKVRW